MLAQLKHCSVIERLLGMATDDPFQFIATVCEVFKTPGKSGEKKSLDTGKSLTEDHRYFSFYLRVHNCLERTKSNTLPPWHTAYIFTK